MRFKVFFLFVAVQLVSFGLWSTLQGDELAVMDEPVANHFAALPMAGIHFGAQNAAIQDVAQEQSRLEMLVGEVFAELPLNHTGAVEQIVLDYDHNAHRGLGGKKMIVLRADMKPREFSAVLVHELGHNVDLVALEAKKSLSLSAFKDGSTPIYSGDPSVEFYGLSWEDEKTMKKRVSNLDFVSGYAMTDPFEDFAETYAYYVLHNKEFSAKAQESGTLAAKYRFMQNRVFDGLIFETGYTNVDSLSRPWDVTVLSYDLAAFLD